MISPLGLALALCGQSTTMNAGAAFNYGQIWVVQPERVAKPVGPSVYQGWNKATEPDFAFVKTVVVSQGDTSLLDTVSLHWAAATGTYEEIHRSSETGVFNKAKLRILMTGLDSIRALHGAAIATTDFNWDRDDASQPWGLLASIEGRDSADGRVFIYKSVGGVFGGTDTTFTHIWEHYDAQGFVTLREAAELDNGDWVLTSRDSMERGSDGKPLHALQWAVGTGTLLTLVSDQRYAWSGRNLTQNAIQLPSQPSTPLVQSYTWNAQGKLVSAKSSLAYAESYDISYDFQGRVVRYQTSTNRFTYGWDASGRIRSVRTDVGYDPDWTHYSLDSFQYDSKGRMVEQRQFAYPLTDSTFDLSKYSSISYDYIANIAVQRVPSRSAPGLVRVEGRTLVGTGLPGKSATLRAMHPDGRQISVSRGTGEVRLDVGETQGRILWVLDVEGAGRTSGNFFRAGR